MRLGQDEPGVDDHNSICQILETAMVYDQLNFSELTCMELMARRLQLVEEKYNLTLQEAESGAEGSGAG